jgi:hypothetical protein
MNPELLAILQRLPPTVLKLLQGASPAMGPAGPVVGGVSQLLHHSLPVAPALSQDQAPVMPKADAEDLTPNAHVARGFNMFSPTAQTLAPNAPSPLDNAQWPAGPVGAPAPSQAGPGPAPAPPMPAPRPPEAPAPTPDMGFFQRNSAMMRDPSSGQFIDPTNAANASQASGPDVIQKLMSYFHNKDNA